MAEGIEALAMEARLRNYISIELKRIQSDLVKTGNQGKRTFSDVSRESGRFTRAVGEARKGFMMFATRFGPAAIAAAALTKALFELRSAIRFVNEKAESFEKVLSRIKAILVPTNEEFAALSQRARALGESTVFSASQVGESFKEMGKLGMNTNQIIAASEGVLDAAAVAEVGMAEAAKVVVSTLNQFQMSASESNRVVDVLAKSINTSAIDIDKFRESMKMAGPVAGATGVEFEELVGTLGVLADNAIDASRAGTSLRRVFLELADVNSKASKIIRRMNPEAQTLVEKFRALRAAGMGATEAKKMFSLRAVTAATIIAKNVDRVEELTATYRNADGTARKFADTMLDNVAGASILLQSAQEGLAIAIGSAFAGEKRKNLELYTQMIRRATEYVIAHRNEIVALAKSLGEVYRFIVSLGGAVMRWVGVVFSSISAVANEAVFLVTSSIKSIMDTVNWVANQLGKEDVFDTTVMAGVIKRSAEGAGKAIQNIVSAFTGEAYAADEAVLKLVDDLAKLKGVAITPEDDDMFPGGGGDDKAKRHKAALKEQEEMYRGMLRARDNWDRENENLLAEAEGRANDVRIAAIRDASERERAELLEKQRRELEDYENHLEAKKKIEQVHKAELAGLDRKFQKQRYKATSDAVVRLSNVIVASLSKQKEELKPIYVAMATMKAATSIITGVKVAWEGAEEIGGVAGVAYGLLMSATTAIENIGLLATHIAAIKSAAKGMDEIVSGAQTIRVGDNPARKERVTVTPLDGPGTMGYQQRGGSNLTIAPVFNVSGNLDRAVGDSILLKLDDIGRNLRSMSYEGVPSV